MNMKFPIALALLNLQQIPKITIVKMDKGNFTDLLSNKPFLNNKLLSEQLSRTKNCNNIPYYELFVIDFLKSAGFTVLDIYIIPELKPTKKDIYIGGSSKSSSNSSIISSIKSTSSSNRRKISKNIIYCNCYKYYLYTKTKTNIKNNIVKYLKNDKLYKLCLEELNRNQLIHSDILVVSHYKYNDILTNYFTNVNKISNELYNNKEKHDDLLNTGSINDYNIYVHKNINNITITKFLFFDRKIDYKLFACLLRNTNSNIKQKTIVGIIDLLSNEQFIIDDSKEERIVRFDWITKTGIFINNNYIIVSNGFEYKYNFRKGNKFLIYISETKLKEFKDLEAQAHKHDTSTIETESNTLREQIELIRRQLLTKLKQIYLKQRSEMITKKNDHELHKNNNIIDELYYINYVKYTDEIQQDFYDYEDKRDELYNLTRIDKKTEEKFLQKYYDTIKRYSYRLYFFTDSIRRKNYNYDLIISN